MENPKQKEESMPVGENLSLKNQELLNYISRNFGGKHFIHGSIMDIPQISVEPQDLWSVCEKLKTSSHTDFKMLLCLAGVDYMEYIQIVYILYSLNKAHTLAIKVDLPYDKLEIQTVSDIWRAANWYEREAHDLFGVDFSGHPDMSPLILFDGFEGYPGRKEFPLHEYDEY